METKINKSPSKIIRYCKECNKPLVAIGNARKNGKAHKDWKNRDTHKSCYKKAIKNSLYDDIYKMMIKNYLLDN